MEYSLNCSSNTNLASGSRPELAAFSPLTKRALKWYCPYCIAEIMGKSSLSILHEIFDGLIFVHIH